MGKHDLPPVYDSLDHWLHYRERESARVARLVGSWRGDAGFLVLRLSSLCPSTAVYDRYLLMCKYWRQITNGRLRHRNVSFGGYRTIEFVETLYPSQGTAMVDVYFTVVTRTRAESLTLLSEWLTVTGQRFNEVVVTSSKGTVENHRVDAWNRPDLWALVRSRLCGSKTVSINVGDQLIGGKNAFEVHFRPVFPMSWRPLFRYKWIIPFGRFDSKTKLRDNFPAPPRPDIEIKQIDVDRYERVVRVEMPPTRAEIRILAWSIRRQFDLPDIRNIVE